MMLFLLFCCEVRHSKGLALGTSAFKAECREMETGKGKDNNTKETGAGMGNSELMGVSQIVDKWLCEKDLNFTKQEAIPWIC